MPVVLADELLEGADWDAGVDGDGLDALLGVVGELLGHVDGQRSDAGGAAVGRVRGCTRSGVEIARFCAIDRRYLGCHLRAPRGGVVVVMTDWVTSSKIVALLLVRVMLKPPPKPVPSSLIGLPGASSSLAGGHGGTFFGRRRLAFGCAHRCWRFAHDSCSRGL